MSDQHSLKREVERLGRVWIRNAVLADEIAQLRSCFPESGKPGSRVAVMSDLSKLIHASRLTAKIKSVWPDMRVVRLVTFDKSPKASWALPWHQDRVIAVDRKVDVVGFSNWSRKDGILHCEPPERFLRNMLFVRLYLDAVDARNGGMEWALGSHQNGLVQADMAEQVATGYQAELEVADPGDALLLNMLTLHRSAASSAEKRRRVIRIDYSTSDLPEPLTWAY